MPDKRNRVDIGQVNFDPTDEYSERARITIARNARDKDDLAFLLDVLGLLPRQEDNPNDLKERRKIEKEKLAEVRRAARQAQWEEQLGILRRNDY